MTAIMSQQVKRALWILDYFPRPHDETTGTWALETIVAIREQIGAPRDLPTQRNYDEHIPKARDALREATGSDEAWQTALAEGAGHSTDRFVEETVTWLRQGDATVLTVD